MENIAINNHNYTQMSKNTVDSKHQLKETEMVKFDHPEGNGIRVTFVGNSITLHGVKPDIGWNNAWGMAASAMEKDYVHLVEEAVLQKDPNASFCICQAASWERRYKNGSETYHLYESARDFDADIIVFRCIENCPGKEFEPDTFKRELGALLKHLDKNGKAKFILTTGFWHHPGDNAIVEYAHEAGYSCIALGDLGERDEMKAIGLFDHSGVANHPGDLGMKTIADRIIAELLPLI